MLKGNRVALDPQGYKPGMAARRAGPGVRTGRGLPFGSPVEHQFASHFFERGRQLSAATAEGLPKIFETSERKAQQSQGATDYAAGIQLIGGGHPDRP